MTKLLLTEAQRELLKAPLGELIEGTFEQTTSKLAQTLAKDRAPFIIAVGDAVSRTLSAAGIRISVAIIDHREKRGPAVEFAPKMSKIFLVSNPAGTIEMAAWQTVQEAIEHGDSLVAVEGEEDLLTLPAILSAPVGGLVVYGQPGRGIVLVHVDEKKQAEIRKMVDSMPGV